MTTCQDCGGKGATAPNGVQYCNCDDENSWLQDCSHAHLRQMLVDAWAVHDALERQIAGLQRLIRTTPPTRDARHD
jgi:hypothetical protein